MTGSLEKIPLRSFPSIWKCCAWVFMGLADLCAILWLYDHFFLLTKGELNSEFDHFAMMFIPFCLMVSLGCLYFTPPYLRTKVHIVYWWMFGAALLASILAVRDYRNSFSDVEYELQYLKGLFQEKSH